MVRRRFKPVRRLGCLILSLAFALPLILRWISSVGGRGRDRLKKTGPLSLRRAAPSRRRRARWRRTGQSPRPGNFYCVRSEEHTYELQSLLRSSYAHFGLRKKQCPTQNTLLDLHVHISP